MLTDILVSSIISGTRQSEFKADAKGVEAWNNMHWK